MAMEILFPLIVLPALVVGFFALLFGLSRVFSPGRVGQIGHDLWHLQFKLWHVVAAVIVAALLLLSFASGPHGEAALPITLLCLLVLAWFLRTWRSEFISLMDLRDEDFPGRFDKLIWVFVLLVFAPFGVWFFRSYRLDHWPEPKPAVSDEFGSEPGSKPATRPA